MPPRHRSRLCWLPGMRAALADISCRGAVRCSSRFGACPRGRAFLPQAVLRSFDLVPLLVGMPRRRRSPACLTACGVAQRRLSWSARICRTFTTIRPLSVSMRYGGPDRGRRRGQLRAGGPADISPLRAFSSRSIVGLSTAAPVTVQLRRHRGDTERSQDWISPARQLAACVGASCEGHEFA
jgi:hypothetical protein